MDEDLINETGTSARINAPLEQIDVSAWCFSLPESEYQACSPAHVSAATTTAPDGRRMSINVEFSGGSLLVQHYVEDVAEPDHLKLVSTSDVFTPTGRTKSGVVWELSVKRIDEQTSELTNIVRTFLTPELATFLARQAIPIELFRAGQKPVLEAHNRQETPLFAQSIERHALRHRELVTA